MPPKNSIQLGPGKMYFSTPEGLKPLGEVQEVELTEEPPELDIEGRTPVRIVQDPTEFSASITLTEETSKALRKIVAEAEAAFIIIRKVLEIVKEMFDSCPNRRVVHLAIRHRDPLVRKKNLKRVARYHRRLTR